MERDAQSSYLYSMCLSVLFPDLPMSDNSYIAKTIQDEPEHMVPRHLQPCPLAQIDC